MAWPDDCDFPPVLEASFVPMEGVPEHEEPHIHATAFGLVQVKLEDGEEQKLHNLAQMDARMRRTAVRTLEEVLGKGE